MDIRRIRCGGYLPPAATRPALCLAAILLLALGVGCGKPDTAGGAGGTDTEAVSPISDTAAPTPTPPDPTDTAADTDALTTLPIPAGSDSMTAATDSAPAPTAGVDSPTAAVPPPPPTPTYVDVDTLRKLATRRYEEKRIAVPPYQRFDTMLTILNRDYGIDYRVRFPDGFDPEAFLSREEILLRVEQDLEREADARFPPERRRRLVEEAKTLFPLYRKGDTVKILLNSGRSVDGEIEYIGSDFVQIDYKKMPFADIVEPDPRSFDPEATQKLRDGHVQGGYDNDRRSYLSRERRVRIPTLLSENGFVNVDGEMIRIDDVIDQRVMPEVTRLERAYLDEQERRIKEEVVIELVDKQLMREPSAEYPLPDLFTDADSLSAAGNPAQPSILVRIDGDILTMRKSTIPYPPTRADLIKVLGDPTRSVPLLANQADLIWDDLGISASINETTDGVDKLTFFYLERDRTMRQFPKNLFTGKLQIEGVTISQKSDPAQINEKQAANKYQKVENRQGLWRSARKPFDITITMEPTGLQTVRLITNRD